MNQNFEQALKKAISDAIDYRRISEANYRDGGAKADKAEAAPMDLLTQAREIAYQGDQAPTDWSMIEVMGRDWRTEAQDAEPVAAAYLRDHLPSWRHLARVEGAHPWLALEARILAQPTLPVPIHECSEPDSIRAACAQWRAALEGGAMLDEDGRWRCWLCAWVMGFDSMDANVGFFFDTIRAKTEATRNRTTCFIGTEWVISIGDSSGNGIWGCYSRIFDANDGGNTPFQNRRSLAARDEAMTPKMVAQAAQQCLIRIPDRILTRFDLRRWQTSLGFEV